LNLTVCASWRAYVRFVIRPDVIRLRHLVIAESAVA
jgi:hypothetical protein